VLHPLRERVGHPIIDADGHMVEFLPLVRDFLRELGGESLATGLDRLAGSASLTRAVAPAMRRALGIARTGWWGLPAANTLDRATAMLPRLLHERLDEIGIDLSILYPTYGLTVMAVDDDELRRGLARAFNRYSAEVFAGCTDRLLPVAVVPTFTPEEAIAELDHAVLELGLRAVLMGGLVLRDAPGHTGDRTARWVDGLGLDSAYDYSPLWQRCVELGVSPTFHSTGIGFGSRTSPTNYVHNHIGNFAAGSEAICRSLFFAGVPRRFPGLRFAFHEGGVAWACSLYTEILGHWHKRNRDAIRHYDPDRLDRDALRRHFTDYGARAVVDRLDRLEPSLQFLSDPTEDPATLDEFAASLIDDAAEVRDVFTRQFFIGCEADDPLIALAFDPRLRPGGAPLRPVLGSDIGHWDVPDVATVLDEAAELLDDGVLTEDEFRALTFGNPIALWGETNPKFFDGTVVEQEARAVLSSSTPT
jgi:predicted TIM-barrel fold metal-dependent hydrolase